MVPLVASPSCPLARNNYLSLLEKQVANRDSRSHIILRDVHFKGFNLIVY